MWSGTLTTDQLVPVGVINAADHQSAPTSSSSSSSSPSNVPSLSEVREASGETAMVLAACHSLVVVQDDQPTPAPAPASASPPGIVIAVLYSIPFLLSPFFRPSILPSFPLICFLPSFHPSSFISSLLVFILVFSPFPYQLWISKPIKFFLFLPISQLSDPLNS